MNILDYITIILFSIGVLITGVSFSKTGKDMKSFFSGGGNVQMCIRDSCAFFRGQSLYKYSCV